MNAQQTPVLDISTNHFSGLAALIAVLAELAKPRLKELSIHELDSLGSCCEHAISSLSHMQFVSSFGLIKMDENGNPTSYHAQDIMATAAETFQELHDLSTNLSFFSSTKA